MIRFFLSKNILFLSGHLLPPVQLQVDDPQVPRDAGPVLGAVPHVQRPPDRRLPRKDAALLHGGVAAGVGGQGEMQSAPQ